MLTDVQLTVAIARRSRWIAVSYNVAFLDATKVFLVHPLAELAVEHLPCREGLAVKLFYSTGGGTFLPLITSMVIRDAQRTSASEPT